jgi:hypothetical protein
MKETRLIQVIRHGGTMHPDRFVGRCLGLLSADQLAALKKNKDLWRKIRTGPTLPLSEIAHADVEGKRLAVALKKRGDKDVYSDEVLVTDELDYVRVVDRDCGRISAECLNSSVWFTVSETTTKDTPA